MNEAFEKWWNTYGKGSMSCFDECNDAFLAGAAAMKERCAEIAEKQEKQLPSSCHMRDFHAEGYNDACEDIAAAIRKEATDGK